MQMYNLTFKPKCFINWKYIEIHANISALMTELKNDSDTRYRFLYCLLVSARHYCLFM